jgi:glycosyltransferase involved in cell wall biosynthesis
MRIAIVHYWLVGMRGGERVLENLCALYPQADIFTHVVDPEAISATLRRHTIRETFIGRLPGARRHYQKYLALMPLALEELDLSGYDLIISSESGPAKGIIPAPGTPHICYCHSPMRYIWDEYHEYRRTLPPGLRQAMSVVAHRLRRWDVSAAARVDRFVANSEFVRKRIGKYYRRDADVLHPPVDLSSFRPAPASRTGYYLIAGQLVPYKKAGLAIEACARMGRRLVVAGTGPELKRLQAVAGPNTEFRGFVSREELAALYAGADALLFPGREDFGIVPLEAMASGTPVIAFAEGGARETVRDGQTGILFADQSVDGLMRAMERFEACKPQLTIDALTAHAATFGEERFRDAFARIVDATLAAEAYGAVWDVPARTTYAA